MPRPVNVQIAYQYGYLHWFGFSIFIPCPVHISFLRFIVSPSLANAQQGNNIFITVSFYPLCVPSGRIHVDKISLEKHDMVYNMSFSLSNCRSLNDMQSLKILDTVNFFCAYQEINRITYLYRESSNHITVSC